MSALARIIDDSTARADLAAVAAPNRFVRSKVRQAAESSSKRLVAASACQLVNTALRRFIALCYESDNSHLWNVAPDGRVLIPTPWSRSKHAAYGLSDTEHRVLRLAILTHNEEAPTSMQLWWYQGGRWYLNRHSYPDAAAALQWLAQWQITPAAWLQAQTRFKG